MEKMGERLIKQGIISPDQLKIALTEQQTNPQPLGHILLQLGFVAEAILRDFFSDTYRYDSIDLTDIVIEPDILALIPEVKARQLKILPIRLHQQHLWLAVSEVQNVLLLDQVNRLLPHHFHLEPLIAGENEILTAIDNNYGFDVSLDSLLDEIETAHHSHNQNEYPPLVRLVNNLLIDAVKRQASDIHFEPEETFLRIRYRIDGVLQQVRSLHKKHWPAIALRLKVMAQLDVTESRQPQDGRIMLSIAGRKIDFRVSTLPTVYGENTVLRILDRHRGILNVQQLTQQTEQVTQLRQLAQMPEGMVLVTGPTGSGKTTTLYALINELNHESVNIMTLEDPVEYKLDLVRQTNINPRLNFSEGLRSILRQDPDIILLGEIRDTETAQMAFRAAITGHQVYATLHAPSAIAVIPRLLDMGIVPDLIADNLHAVINQRLVRKLCPQCKTAHPIDASLYQKLQPIYPKLAHDGVIYQAKGCSFCQYFGYKGRLALLEILWMHDALKQHIVRQSDIYTLKNSLLVQQQQNLVQQAVQAVCLGQTSLAEIQRILFLPL